MAALGLVTSSIPLVRPGPFTRKRDVMPCEVTYSLKLDGTLRGSKYENDNEIKKFREVFPDKPDLTPRAKENDPFPRGLILPDYKVTWQSIVDDEPTARWDTGLAAGAEKLTRLTFKLDATKTVEGTLFDNYNAWMKDHVEWFHQYCGKKWQQDLVAKVKKLNADLGSKVLNPIDFRDFQWYSGNGGGT